MLIYRPNEYTVYMINEYWILIPLSVGVNLLICRQIRRRRIKRAYERAQLRKLIERNKKLERIALLSLGLNGYYMKLLQNLRAGDDTPYIKLDTPECVETGLRLLTNKRIKSYIIREYYYKVAKNKVVYITATALCHLVKRYGRSIADYGLAPDCGIIKISKKYYLTSIYQFLRRLTIVIFTGGSVTMAYGKICTALIPVFLTFALRLIFEDNSFIKSFPIIKETTLPLISGDNEVVSIHQSNKVTMTKKLPYECWDQIQSVFSENCRIRSHQIPEAIDLADEHNLREIETLIDYDKVVNMHDVTGLDKNQVQFSDRQDLGGQIKSNSILKEVKGSVRGAKRAKMVTYSEMFPPSTDPSICDVEVDSGWEDWDSIKPIRIKNDYTYEEY